MERYESYKDSGIEWIGKIPSHWKIYRFKDFLTLQNVVSSNENKIGLENIEGGTGRFIETNTDFDGNGIEFDVGDIVYGKLRPYLQKVWVATFNGNAVGDFFVFRTKPICDRQYVFYVMLSEGFTAICNGATFGTKMPRVSSDFIRCLHFYLPPFVEQQAIAAYLDKRCCEIDKAIATQQKRIALLQELKQSIITHAVTRGIHPDVPLKESGVEWIGKVPEHWDIKRMRFLCTIDTGTRDTIDKVDDGDYPFYVRSPKIERINTYTFDGEAVLMAGDGVGAGKVIHYANGKFDYHQRVYNIHNYREIATLFAYYYLQSNFRYKIDNTSVNFYRKIKS